MCINRRCRRSYLVLFFFFNDTAPPETYTLSLPDALPIEKEKGGVQTEDRVGRGGGWGDAAFAAHLRFSSPSSGVEMARHSSMCPWNSLRT